MSSSAFLRRFRLAPTLLAVAMAVASARTGAHQAAAQGPAQSSATFRSVTRLVVQTVSVKDKDGHVVEGLKPADFTVTEDGVPQTVSFAEFERLPEPAATPAAAPDMPASAPLPPAAPPKAAVASTTTSQITTSAPGQIRYASRRLLVLYFDMTSMGQNDLLRAFSGARKYITTQMTPADVVAVMTFQGSAVRANIDFTSDKDELLNVIDTLAAGTDASGNGMSTAIDGSTFGQDDAEFQLFNTDRQLSALQSAVEMLRPLPEQKVLLYFASGLQLSGVGNQAQLRATTNAALRANVQIFPVDARGLVASAPLGDATQASPGGMAMFSGQTAGTRVTALQQTQDTLFSIAKDTGGKAMFDNNDLSLGIVDAARSITSYYIVGFYSNHTALDGKFHRVKITVTSPLATDVSYRQGYYADTEFAKSSDADRERQLQQALVLENPVTDLTIETEINYFQLNRAEYYVPVSMKIPGSELTLARKGGAAHALIDFIGEVRDEFGATQQNVRDKVDVKLTDQTAAQLDHRPIQYLTGFTLLPGTYTLKMLARDNETGHIGTYQKTFVIPNLDRETKRLPTSSVVLGSQRVGPTDALFSIQNKQADAADPLIVDGQRLIPSVTRVFSQARTLYVFLQAYEHGAAAIEPLAGFVSFYQGASKVFETPVLAVTDGLDPKSKAVPLW
ncbi:MAG TPA: VWA domain-containing protein, partial [Vicinamibacterales bacterium]